MGNSSSHDQHIHDAFPEHNYNPIDVHKFSNCNCEKPLIQSNFFDYYSICFDIPIISGKKNLYETIKTTGGKSCVVKILDFNKCGYNEAKHHWACRNIKGVVPIFDIYCSRFPKSIIEKQQLTICEDMKFYFIVIEYLHGGDIHDNLMTSEYYSEENSAGFFHARSIMKSVVNTVHDIHEIGIGHYNIKAENLVYRDQLKTKPMLCDFEFASCENQHTIVYTIGYAAPEISKYIDMFNTKCALCEMQISNNYDIMHKMNIDYDKSVDTWAIGILLYLITYYRYPFGDNNAKSIYEKTLENNPRYKTNYDEINSIIKSFLVVEPNNRKKLGKMN